MIHPTIGRVVWFQPAKAEHTPLKSQPYAALVACVHSDRMVNLGGFDANGQPFSACSVTLLQDDDAAPAGGYYASWMPYQTKQAEKAEPSTLPYPAFPPAVRD